MTTTAYTLHFSDGKKCTMIDPEREPKEKLESDLKAMFHPGYLVRIDAIDETGDDAGADIADSVVS